MVYMKNIPKEHEILIAGGGITGAALAYGLVKAGKKVTVIDAPTETNNASRTNVGLIWCQSKFLHLPDYAKWGFLSAKLFPALTAELEDVSGVKIPVNYTGGLIASLSEEDFNTRSEYIAKLKVALGEYKGHMIDRSELERKLPRIAFGPEVVGAAWCENDGLIDPLALLRAFHVAFQKLGGNLQRSLIYDVQPKDIGYLLNTSHGPLACERLVLAAGLANKRLAAFAMPNIPVFADKGQVLLVERMPMVMPIPMLGVTQTFGGTVIIGFKHETVGHDTRVVPASVATEGQWAIRVWPELGRKRLLRTWSGLRVMPDDKQAIYSHLPNHPDVTLVNTHSAVTLAAVHARLLPEFIMGGQLPELAQGMTLKRFGYSC